MKRNQIFNFRAACLVKFLTVFGVIPTLPVAAQSPQQTSEKMRISVISPNTELEELTRQFDSIIAQVNPGAKKIKRVTVSLKRINPNTQQPEFWTGKEWAPGVGGELEQRMHLAQGKWVFSTRGAFSPTENYKYWLEVGVIDENDRLAYVNRSFVMDWSPNVVISFPRKGSPTSSLSQPNLVRGATKTLTGTRLQFVHLFLSRRDFEGGTDYWNGTGWQKSIPAAIPATTKEERPDGSNNVTSWLWDRQVPAKEQLRDGDYRLEVVAANQHGQKTVSTTTFVIANAPILRIQSPSSGSKVSSSPKITGTLSLPTTDATFKGEIRVELSKFKLQPVSYWNGRQWIKKPTTLPVTLQSPKRGSSSKVWHLKDVPLFSQLEDGTYRAVVWAYEGSTTVSADATFFEVDRGPETTIISPLTSGTHKRGKKLPVVRGRVAIGIGKGAIRKLSLTLSRLPLTGGGEVWTGKKWVKAPSTAAIALTTAKEPSGVVSWVWAKDLPPASSIVPGLYIVTIGAFDSHGRSAVRSLSFNVQP